MTAALEIDRPTDQAYKTLIMEIYACTRLPIEDRRRLVDLAIAAVTETVDQTALQLRSVSGRRRWQS